MELVEAVDRKFLDIQAKRKWDNSFIFHERGEFECISFGLSYDRNPVSLIAKGTLTRTTVDACFASVVESCRTLHTA